MELPEFDTETLSRMRMQECQGTIIGGMMVAASHGCEPQRFGQEMMEMQNIRWDSISGNLQKIAQVFYQHYQTTYGFGSGLKVEVQDDQLLFTMPPISKTAAYQLSHWRATAEQLHDVQRGYWQALTKHCAVVVELNFGEEADQIRVRKK